LAGFARSATRENLGDNLLEHLQLLVDQVGRHHGIAGEVIAWPCEIPDEPAGDRINNPRHDDGDGAGRSLCSQGRRRTIRHDDVDLESDQIGREAGKPAVLPLRPPGLKHDVPTFHIAELAQAFPEGPEQDGQGAGVVTGVKRSARRQNAYSGNLRRLRLCEGCEWRRECARAKRNEQFSAIHPTALPICPHCC
jgi:hypothetical protein